MRTASVCMGFKTSRGLHDAGSTGRNLQHNTDVA